MMDELLCSVSFNHNLPGSNYLVLFSINIFVNILGKLKIFCI